MKSSVNPQLSIFFQEGTMKARGRHQLWKNMDSRAQWSTWFLSLWYPSNLPCHFSPVKCQKLLARGLLLLVMFKAVSKEGNNSFTDLNFLLFHTWNLFWNEWKLYLGIEGTARSAILWRQTEDICLEFAVSLILYLSKNSTMKPSFHQHEFEFNFSRTQILSLMSQPHLHC